MGSLIPFNRNDDSWPSFWDSSADLGNVIENFFGKSWGLPFSLQQATFKIDVRENDGEYSIEAELPGVRKDEIRLDAREQTLCIGVSRREKVDDRQAGYIHRERRTTSMSRSVRLVDGKMDQIHAKLENGVLHISVAKRNREDRPRKITIE
jgi:HSP20 family protein